MLNSCSSNKIVSFIFFDRTRRDLLDDGIEKSKKLLAVMFRHVQNALDRRQVIKSGPFYYMVIQEVKFILFIIMYIHILVNTICFLLTNLVLKTPRKINLIYCYEKNNTITCIFLYRNL